MTLNAFSRPTLNVGFKLQWEPVQEAHVLLYPEGMIKLNLSAAEILRRCDGSRTLIEVVADLERAFDNDELTNDVRNFIESALQSGWLRVLI